jgi:hypothetical protein
MTTLISKFSKIFQRAGGFTCVALSFAIASCGPGQSSATTTKSPLADPEAGDNSFRNFRLRDAIAIPGNPLAAYDISWVDQANQTYYLADRSNAGVDIFNAQTDTFVARVGGFVGADPRGNDFSGPNGVLVINSQNQLWAGDGPRPHGAPGQVSSSVKVIDLSLSPPQIIDTIWTNGELRSDEMAYDPEDRIFAVVNNADDPPFFSLISTLPPRQVLKKIVFDETLAAKFGLTGFTGGLEQPVYDVLSHLFYVSVPELNGDADRGAIAVIDPRKQEVTKLFYVNRCTPAGLTLGPDQNLLIGCSDPSRTVVMKATDGSIVATILDVGGSDEVWYNSEDQHYYLAARNDPSGPVLGVIDATNNTFTTKVTTAFNSHSVAVNRHNNHVFVPLTRPRPNTTDPDPCAAFGAPARKGCIGVYWRIEEQFD